MDAAVSTRRSRVWAGAPRGGRPVFAAFTLPCDRILLTAIFVNDNTITTGDIFITRCLDWLSNRREGGFSVKFLFPVGRVLFSLIFITASPRHFTHEGIQHAADLGVPLAALMVPLAGVLAIIGGMSIAVGYKTRWGAWLLIAFLVPVTIWMH